MFLQKNVQHVHVVIIVFIILIILLVVRQNILVIMQKINSIMNIIT